MKRSDQLARLNRRMNAIPKAVREAALPAVVKSADEMANRMRHLAPVDTGALKESIHVTKPGQTTPPYSQPGGERKAGPLSALVTVGNTDVRYPHLVEYGTTENDAQPFFWPSVRLLKKRAKNRIKRAVGKAVREEWKR